MTRILLVSLLALSTFNTFAAELSIAKDDVILAFGDSLTVGIGGSGTDYPARLQQLIKRKVINAGSSGELTGEAISRLERTLVNTEADFMILCHGQNDFYANVPEVRIKANLIKLINTAQAKNLQVLVLGLPEPGKNGSHALFQTVTEQTGSSLDLTSISQVLSNPLYKADPAHLNADGYRLLANNLAETLKPWLE